MRLTTRVRECDEIPRWAGVVGYDFARADVICAPLGLHVLIAWCSRFMRWLRFGHVDKDRLGELYAEVGRYARGNAQLRIDVRRLTLRAQRAEEWVAETERDYGDLNLHAQKWRKYAMRWLALTHRLGIDPEKD